MEHLQTVLLILGALAAAILVIRFGKAILIALLVIALAAFGFWLASKTRRWVFCKIPPSLILWWIYLFVKTH